MFEKKGLVIFKKKNAKNVKISKKKELNFADRFGKTEKWFEAQNFKIFLSKDNPKKRNTQSAQISTSSDFKATGYWDVDFWFPDTRELGGKEFVTQKYYLRLFLDNWMRRTSNVELARIPYNDGRRHGPYESHHLLRHQGIKKTIGYASTLAVVLIKIHVGRKLNAGDTKGVSLEFGKWVMGLWWWQKIARFCETPYCKSEEGT
ncbi:hypothetical protein RhiirC2_789977 [Rhizophagus irregularis]|uniref:Uncharacterized protein n=1 Tax=Rhizophagus irregularis TaxID=588596 RepID=A0A2N1MM33_9GLOM|nr:hypothetical protein RhiirC2_789977 [Rhizophagus irregularis]